MDRTDTRQRLDRITDPGLFGELATAVLRELDLRCRLVAHVGTNPEGRTVPSPLDGITYFSDEGVRHVVAVHHTIQKHLRPKWLTEPDGDLPKTIDLFRRQKDRIPELRATLILTTNREPPEKLVHDVEAAGYDAGIDVEIYPGSVIAHFLDTEPKGQWLRQNYLGVSQTTLSEELLRELSVRSIEEGLPNAESWVPRAIDEQLAIHSLYPVSFIVGESGMGKTVACLKCLQDYVVGGATGLLVTAKVLGESHSVADAIDATLRRLHPPLAVGEGRRALSLASHSSPLLIVVEDVNRSAAPTRLLEKLASWGKTAVVGQEPIQWRVLCPVWPRRIAAVSDQSRETVDKSTIWVGPFSDEEGIAAVQRCRLEPLPLLAAKAIASSLGHDPLLIALHGSGDSNPDPTAVIKDFLQRRLERLAEVGGGYTAGEYWRALRSLSLALLEHKELGPSFTDVVEWMGEQSITAHMLREIVKAGEVARLGRPLACSGDLSGPCGLAGRQHTFPRANGHYSRPSPPRYGQAEGSPLRQRCPTHRDKATNDTTVVKIRSRAATSAYSASHRCCMLRRDSSAYPDLGGSLRIIVEVPFPRRDRAADGDGSRPERERNGGCGGGMGVCGSHGRDRGPERFGYGRWQWGDQPDGNGRRCHRHGRGHRGAGAELHCAVSAPGLLGRR